MAQIGHELALHSMKNRELKMLCEGVQCVKFRPRFVTGKGVETLKVAQI